MYFNSIVIIDADGSQVGVYRKSHIPDGPGYQEKFYFSPGDTGFHIYKTRFATIGVGICSDQWYPEAARVMALQGAELLLYPTAIGSEPQDPSLDTCGQWQRCMQGHSAANMMPVIAANRVGKEIASSNDVSITFYGSSFMTDHTGGIVSDAGRHQEIVLTHMYNLDEIRAARHRGGLFRDRRPELYSLLCSFDGNAPHVMSMERRSVPSQSPGPPPVVTTPVAQAALSAAFPAPPRVALMPSPTATPSTTPTPVTMAAISGAKKVEPEALVSPHTMVPVVDETQRRVVNNTFDLHEASFIGEVKGNSQRRPRGRCWVCRAKTTYECKLCPPGPVPLCNRTARECWWKYHAGEVTPYVPNKRGRKRRKIEDSLSGGNAAAAAAAATAAAAAGVSGGGPAAGDTSAAAAAAAAAEAVAVGEAGNVQVQVAVGGDVPGGATGDVVGDVPGGATGDVVDGDGDGDNDESDDVADDKCGQQESDAGTVGALLG